MKEPLRQAKFFIAETNFSRLPAALSEVAFVGRSNAGKSSLLCKVCDNKTLARVSKTPGRTRGINVFEVIRGRWLVDLPGYGYAKAPQKEREYWPTMMGHYMSGRPTLALVLVLVDGEVGVGDTDFAMLNWLKDNNINARIVGTKVDRISPSRQFEFRKKMAESLGLAPNDIHWVSSKKGYGIDALRTEIISSLGL